MQSRVWGNVMLGNLRKIGLVLAASVMAGWAVPSFAADIAEDMSAEEIDSLLSGAGFNTTLMSDKSEGTPVAVARLGQVNFVVRALSCEGAPARCSQLLFFANFDLGRTITNADYRVVNDFNDSSYDGRAYVLEDSGEIGVDFIIDLTGGVTPAHIQSRLGRWQGIVSDFLREMNAAQTGS
ncbi:YbjN domain-containing protein [Parvularcula flava]|uniref:YbjN domain-containing protein n=1 Tax=Aquisalinus luteolus TaxID=1566827 RepID=A0A8J3ER94_9PROT|nr:YbjN domain-containing protein [Aquisalinus luteolus]NHK28225.1 YbjN domain-containing protein [Aquisalinus luteolus]GGH97840.1 hypothetical protein GCM10011355_20020 [Aquisalinus luteolus]